MIDLNPDQIAIRDGVAAVCRRFGDEYWNERDRDERFPHEFHRAMADDGWLGVQLPGQVEFSMGLGVVPGRLVALGQITSEQGSIRLQHGGRL